MKIILIHVNKKIILVDGIMNRIYGCEIIDFFLLFCIVANAITCSHLVSC